MVIPVRGNKYYIPSNRNSQSTEQKFGEEGIPKTFDTLMSKNYKLIQDKDQMRKIFLPKKSQAELVGRLFLDEEIK